MADSKHAACPLCTGEGGEVLWRWPGFCRVVWPDEASHPEIVRVVSQWHVGDLSDLAPFMREAMMVVVMAIEASMRRVLQPTKVNLASLGNEVPHAHWHVIGRFHDDAQFPKTIWAAPIRSVSPAQLAHRRDAVRAWLPQLTQALISEFQDGSEPYVSHTLGGL